MYGWRVIVSKSTAMYYDPWFVRANCPAQALLMAAKRISEDPELASNSHLEITICPIGEEYKHPLDEAPPPNSTPPIE